MPVTDNSAADIRWMCTLHTPAVLLAKRSAEGELHIKVGAREWRVAGFRSVTAVCPKCGAQHTIEDHPELQRALPITNEDPT